MSTTPNTVMHFTEEQAARLAEISVRRVKRWREQRILRPLLADPTDPTSLLSFRDLVGLRTLALLRESIPLHQLRRVGEWLHERYQEPWASLRFTVVGREVQFDDPTSGKRFVANPQLGQTVIQFDMAEIVEDVEARVAKLFARREFGKIDERHGLIAGTRVRTSAVWAFHLEGSATDDIIAQFPNLTSKDVEAAIAYERDREVQKGRQAG